MKLLKILLGVWCLITVGILIYFYLPHFSFLNQIKEKIDQKDQSNATLEVRGQTLNIQFNITEKDKKLAAEFSKNLDINTSWEDGISMDLDNKTISLLNEYLPAKTNLHFETKKVEFQSDNALQAQIDLVSATSSGDLIVKPVGSGYQIDINDPALVLNEQMSNNKIKLSPKLSNIWQLLQRVAKINLKVGKGVLDGAITLN